MAKYWRCSKIYIDESWVHVKGKGDLLMVGALFCPPGDNIESMLERLRNDIGCTDTLHSSSLSGKKQYLLASQFIKIFKEGTSQFRVIVMPKLRDEFKKFCNSESWRMKVKAIKMVLSFPYLYPQSDDIRLIKPKIIIEYSSDYKVNKKYLKSEIFSSLSTRQVYQDIETFRVKPVPIIELSGKKVFESLQLVDILLGLIKWSISLPPKKNEKFDLFEKYKNFFEVSPLYKANRFNTNGKINIWPFNKSDNIFKF